MGFAADCHSSDSTLHLPQQAAHRVARGHADVIVFCKEAAYVLSMPCLAGEVDLYASCEEVETLAV